MLISECHWSLIVVAFFKIRRSLHPIRYTISSIATTETAMRNLNKTIFKNSSVSISSDNILFEIISTNSKILKKLELQENLPIVLAKEDTLGTESKWQEAYLSDKRMFEAERTTARLLMFVKN